MGNHERALEWLKVKRNSIVSQEEVLKHFYSQLTKEDIRGIYEKYRVVLSFSDILRTISFSLDKKIKSIRK